MNGKACNVCKYCAELKTPYERSDGAYIYGYCFKNGDKDYSFGEMHASREQESEAWNRRADRVQKENS